MMQANDITTSSFGLQGKISDLHQLPDDCEYGTCAYLSYAVLQRGLQNAAKGENFDFDTAAKDVYARLKGDRRRARAFDYITIGQAARSAGITPRAMLGAGPYIARR